MKTTYERFNSNLYSNKVTIVDIMYTIVFKPNIHK